MARSFVYNDGGATLAGYSPDAGDCVPRAIAIATGMEYRTVLDGLNALAKTSRLKKNRRHVRSGTSKRVSKLYLARLGWKWTPTMTIGSGCKVHLRADELPKGTLIVAVSKHLCAVIDGVIHDTYDPSREGTRCVYGYWQQDLGTVDMLRFADAIGEAGRANAERAPIDPELERWESFIERVGVVS